MDKIDFIELIGFPLGATKKDKFQQTEIDLSKKTMVIYSDGLIEALDTTGEPIGYDRFARLAWQATQQTISPPGDETVKMTQKLTNFTPFDDDASVVFITPISSSPLPSKHEHPRS